MSPVERSSQLQNLIESLTNATTLPIEWEYMGRGRAGKLITIEDVFKCKKSTMHERKHEQIDERHMK